MSVIFFRGQKKQLSENDVIVMDDETFLAVVDDMSMDTPSKHVMYSLNLQLTVF